MAKGFPENRENIAAALKALRAQYDMTQEDLAMIARTTVQSISTLERSNGNPVLTNLERMAAALKTTVPGLILLGEELTMEKKATIREVFSSNLKKIRLAKNLSQTDLSRGTGIAVSYISNLERTKHSISLDKLELLARFLGVSEADLVQRE